ncbi:diguanylate cyclase [Hylemonella gracilis str. Niagara R]|uniref:diguanylate cyclase n=1 Tax=Hylemonella gracilis str. Niagara R TaxID=1458275 RepID=A0A016XDF6_9BURK|nr:sensor domain-containing diguanylate cyclase [Hylemonella gracilis]EYC49866.1 diguanylate cyclase [Hylemonella gracilis str. Niagara R]
MNTDHTRLRLLDCLDDAASGIALFDPDDRLRYANDYMRASYGIAPAAYPSWADMMRNCFHARVGLLIQTDDIEGWLREIGQRRRQTTLRCFESDMVDGRWMRVTETLHENGWLLNVITDISTLKAQESLLQQARDHAVQLAITDPLTGLFNRRHVFEQLGALFQQARSLRYPLTLAAIDLDHFKQINDNHGHSVGDQVLTHFARKLEARRRPQDLVGRIGGEEFLMALPNTTVQGTRQVLTRLRQDLSDSRPVPDHPQLRLSFSSGLAQIKAQDTDASALYQRADRALYGAKNAGRARDLDDDAPTTSAKQR